MSERARLANELSPALTPRMASKLRLGHIIEAKTADDLMLTLLIWVVLRAWVAWAVVRQSRLHV